MKTYLKIYLRTFLIILLSFLLISLLVALLQHGSILSSNITQPVLFILSYLILSVASFYFSMQLHHKVLWHLLLFGGIYYGLSFLFNFSSFSFLNQGIKPLYFIGIGLFTQFFLKPKVD